QGNADSGPRLTRADHVMGTPDFMAPEQAMGGEVDARADLYALGGVAFWLLAARPVFLARSVLAQLTAQTCEQPGPIQEVCAAQVPPALADLIHRCLAKMPEDRPQTAREVIDVLQAIDAQIGAEWDSKVAAWWASSRTSQPETMSKQMTLKDVQGTAQTLNIAVSQPVLNIVRR